MSADCVFCRIVRGEIPARKVHEDGEVLVFHDIHPSAPVHLLIIPKAHIANLYDVDPAYRPLLGRMLGMAGDLARAAGADDGFRVVVHNGRAGGQEVFHLHLHVLGGPDRLGSGMPTRPVQPE